MPQHALTTELAYLVWAAALCAVLWLPYVLARITTWGLSETVGYPDNPPDLPKWAQRSYRAHMNLAENLPVFASLVLVATLMQAGNAMTALGAALFFWARIVQAVVHIAGVPWVRTLAFAVSWVGLLLIFLQIVT